MEGEGEKKKPERPKQNEEKAHFHTAVQELGGGEEVTAPNQIGVATASKPPGGV